MTSAELAQKITDLALEKKGKQIVKIDIKNLTDYADYFVIVTGESGLQIKAIVDYIEDELAKEGIRAFSKEGYEYQRWVLLDYIDVVVHVFNHEAREFYGIERLYADANMEYINDEAV